MRIIRQSGSYSKPSIRITEKNIDVAQIINEKIQLCLYKDAEKGIDDGNPNCEWMWVSLKRKFESNDEALEWFRTNFDSLRKQYKFYDKK